MQCMPCGLIKCGLMGMQLQTQCIFYFSNILDQSKVSFNRKTEKNANQYCHGTHVRKSNRLTLAGTNKTPSQLLLRNKVTTVQAEKQSRTVPVTSRSNSKQMKPNIVLFLICKCQFLQFTVWKKQWYGYITLKQLPTVTNKTNTDSN